MATAANHCGRGFYNPFLAEVLRIPFWLSICQVILANVLKTYLLWRVCTAAAKVLQTHYSQGFVKLL
jgi:hypothetical protein